MIAKYEYDNLDEDDYEYSQRISSWANHETEPLLHEPEETKLKFFPATAIIVASMTGVGVLAFPLAFVYAGGPLNSILIQIPFLIFCWITINAIGLVIRKYDVDQYESMISGKFNPSTHTAFFFGRCGSRTPEIAQSCVRA